MSSFDIFLLRVFFTNVMKIADMMLNPKSPYIPHAFFRLSLSSGQDSMILQASSFLLSR